PKLIAGGGPRLLGAILAAGDDVVAHHLPGGVGDRRGKAARALGHRQGLLGAISELVAKLDGGGVERAAARCCDDLGRDGATGGGGRVVGEAQRTRRRGGGVGEAVGRKGGVDLA